MVFSPFRDTKEMANHFRDTFKWHKKGASLLSRSLSEDYQDLCPSFTLSDAEGAVLDFLALPK